MTKNVTHKDLMEASGRWEKKKKEKTKKKPETPTRNADEYRNPARKQRFRDTEAKALQQIENLYRTPASRITHKKPAILRFEILNRHDGSLKCTLPDGYIIHVEPAFSKLNIWKAYYVSEEKTKRAGLSVIGTNRADAIATLLGKKQFKYKFGQRWVSFYALCYPHIIIPGHHNTPPSNAGAIPTQAWLYALENVEFVDEPEPEEPRKFVLPQGKYKSFEELRRAMREEVQEKPKEEPEEKPAIPDSVREELEEELTRGSVPFCNPLHRESEYSSDRDENLKYFGIKRK